MALHHRKESPATPASLMSEARFEKSIPTTTPLDKLLLRHYVCDDGQPFGVRVDVKSVVWGQRVDRGGRGMTITRVLHDSSPQEGVPCHS